MATAFTEQEKTLIVKTLQETARECAATIGMRKTTVDQLAESASISKGAFYKFYETKELLFFEVLEGWHAALYSAALEVLMTRGDLSNSERAAAAVLKVCEIIEQNSMMDFFENDLPYLLRKIPFEILAQHYHGDESHLREIIAQSGIPLTQPPELACAAIRALFLTLPHRKQIGEQYQQVLRLLVQGACDRLVSN